MDVMYLGDWLGRRARLSPTRVALFDAQHGMQPLTYREWNERVNQTAHLLRDMGVARGDRVAALAQNCVDLLDLWFACAKLGAIFQPLNWRLTAAELRDLIVDGEPRVLAYGPEYAAMSLALRPQTPFVAHWLAIDDAPAADPSDLTIARRNAFPTHFEAVPLSWDDPWVICYTGGSTGLPKGAILTYRSIAANAVNTVMSWGLRPDDVAILNAPLFHTGGLNVFTAPLLQIGGASIVCRSFNVDQVFDLIDHGPATLFFGVPTMFIAMQQHPRWPTVDFSRMRIVISGGAPCPEPVFHAFWARGIDFKTGYGLTEAGPNTFWLPPELVREKPGAVGYPLMFIDVRVVAADGRECGVDEIGELQIRGPHVCAGYWRRPAETAAAFRDGWLRTGDLASFDADGCFRIVGRLKDVIISGGENIYPAEVESVLAGHPAVAEVALVGMPDPHWGEVGWAAVVVRPGSTFSEQDLITFAGLRLARYKLPKRIVTLAELPKTGAGKIDKQAIKHMFQQLQV
ncbi:MAG TPA: long-chain fatty acid--CoA ligase [Chloroflexus aurantiacus]|jgi:fatty-acyl-CoA synthase|uniref:AMP-dependent synthetase and ligase n=2 Tax=Chloroflexus TaxID=1107 RepID=A9WAM1_CHLAA|nr:AMP-dependent synthetase and ligase [Chloroflexus aurantiacus J-10-fl]HBW66587.1 long-chain fatty acid--CoA ligase [Chloroflexus aurantiacus]